MTFSSSPGTPMWTTLLRHRHHQPGAGGRGLPGGHPPPARLAGPCGLHRPGPTPVRGLRQRGQHRLHGGPLHRRQEAPPRRRLLPGNRAGLRPDRATIVYANRVREVFGDIPLVIGGLEASLRRFAHYDYWEDKVRRSILLDAQADLLSYGMGERATREIAAALALSTPVEELTGIKGTCFLAKGPRRLPVPGGDGGLPSRR